MPHQYLACYRWIRDVFGAHAVIHTGTHGTLTFYLDGGRKHTGDSVYPACIPSGTSVENIFERRYIHTGKMPENAAHPGPVQFFVRRIIKPRLILNSVALILT